MKIYDDESRLLFLCKGKSSFGKFEWDVYDNGNVFILNFTFYNVWYALLRRIEYGMKVTSANKEYHLIENIKYDGIKPYSEVSVVEDPNSEKVIVYWYTRKPCPIKDAADNQIGLITISDGFELNYHTSEIECNQAIELERLIVLFLTQENSRYT
jgi:hypothetical protein